MTTRSKKSKPAEEQAQQVLDILNRWDARMRGHQTQRRSHERVPFAGRILVYHREKHCATATDAPIVAFGRNVSPTGIGFIYPERIKSKRVILCLNPDHEEPTWLHAEIVRARVVHHEFWEYGARFLRRADRTEIVGAAEANPV